jgi:adenylate kinase family enzyme
MFSPIFSPNVSLQQIREGKIVPVVITVNLIKKAIEREVANGKTVFLVDGFPRDTENVKGEYTIQLDIHRGFRMSSQLNLGL